MTQFALVFLGGGLGSALRYLMSRWLNETSINLPLGTFVVNVLGCLIIGYIFGLSLKNGVVSQTTLLFLATGFCGGFTTFSTFSFENHTFLKERELPQFFGYTLLSLICGSAMVWLGLWLVK